MKINENDPRLTAYAFGELPREEAEAVRKAIQGKPELRRYVDELMHLNDLLAAGFGSGDSLKLHPEQRAAIHQAGKNPQADNIVSMRQSAWKRPLVAILSAAAALTVCFFVVNKAMQQEDEGLMADHATIEDIPASELTGRVSPNPSEWVDSRTAEAGTTKSVPSSEGEAMTMSKAMEQQALELRQEIENRGVERPKRVSNDQNLEKENEWVIVSQQSSTRVPMMSGSASWKWITQTLQAGFKPISEDVRVEELINHFSYVLPKDFLIGGIDAGAEIIRCPWDEDKLLALVHIRNNSEEEPMVEVGLTFGYQINSYRLLGYNHTLQESGHVAPTVMKMQSGYGQMILYELDPGVELEEGHKALTVHVNASQIENSDHRSFGVEFAEREWESTSSDVRLALLMASWARNLKAENDTDITLTLEILNSLQGQIEDQSVLDSLKVIEKSLGK